MDNNFKNVFTPYKFKSKQIEIANRIVMPPMAIYIPGSKGYVEQRLIDYYEERAKSQPGMIIINATSINLTSARSHPNQTSLADDSFIDGMKKLVDMIHSYGVKTSVQLYHSGRQRYGMIAGGETMSPSGISDPVRKDPTREMKVEEIKILIQQFTDAAVRAKKAGFDGIELHCGHGYLLSGFLSPYQNRRTDEYGGSLFNRTRLVREIIASCRKAIGPEMLIGVRMNGSDYINGGNTLEDTKQIAKILVEHGAEIIHVTAGMAPSGHFTFLPADMPAGCNIYLAEGIKEAVGEDIPVIGAGAVEDIFQAEKILSETNLDFVAIGRPMFADPELLIKAREGRVKEIRPCLRCSKSAGVWPEDMRCTVNAAVGIEKEFAKNLTEIGPSKKLLVIGAGPAGLEAARVAAMKGHNVTLMDEREEIGGKMHLVRVRPDKQKLIDRWMKYYENEIERLNISLRLGEKANIEKVEEISPDLIIIATGGKPLVPRSIKGTDCEGVLFAEDIIAGKVHAGKNIAIIGGSSLGVEIADYLFDEDENRKIVVFEMMHDVLLDISHDAHLSLMDRFIKRDVKFLTSTEVFDIRKEGKGFNLKIKRYNQLDEINGFDTVVLACGVVPENSLGVELAEKFDNVIFVGDSQAPGDFRKAIHDSAKICMKL